MRDGTRTIVPDRPIPGRYALEVAVGRSYREYLRWRRRRDAEQIALWLLREGAVDPQGRRYTGARVYDRINGRYVFETTAPKKRYG